MAALETIHYLLLVAQKKTASLLGKIFYFLAPPLVYTPLKCSYEWIDALISNRRFKRHLKSRLGRGQLEKQIKLNLGSAYNILEGWLNIDKYKFKDVLKLDLRRKFPIENDMIDCIFTEHLVEHLVYSDAEHLIHECYRVLKRDGVLRISTPGLEKFIKDYKEKCITEWKDFGWLPKTPCKLINEGMRRWGHKFIFDEDELSSLLSKAGFRDIRPVKWHESRHDALKNLERRPYHGELILEGVKH